MTRSLWLELFYTVENGMLASPKRMPSPKERAFDWDRDVSPRAGSTTCPLPGLTITPPDQGYLGTVTLPGRWQRKPPVLSGKTGLTRPPKREFCATVFFTFVPTSRVHPLGSRRKAASSFLGQYPRPGSVPSRLKVKRNGGQYPPGRA